jgi:pimeloyl-ACP methyl ester carboxylesterase
MKMDFLEFGGKGRPIVFLHGWQQDKKSFTTLVPYLFRDYHLYLLDLPGFGKSDPPPPDFNSWDYANSIKLWISDKKLGKVILVGHSFGGKIAAILAKENPDMVSRLILIANSGLPENKAIYKFTDRLPTYLKKPFARLTAGRDYKNAGKLLPIFKTVVKEDLTETFSRIKIPTLIIWGRNDQELPIKQAEIIQNLIEGSRLEIVDTGHFPFLEEPEKIALSIHNFIGAGHSERK